ncbi:hypothetical protein E4U51_008644 [Claviceps purpurea]|nr:hypothetical protein E4U51_008644 [Claviceps purpurea]
MSQSSPMDESLYVLHDIPGKGKGLVATRDIPKGTRIIAEQALFTIPGWDALSLEEQKISICQQMDALSDDQRDTFMSLHNALPFDNAPEQYYGIFQTNCLPLDKKYDSWGIFLKACRVNHDCANSACNNWNENIKRYTLHALRNIRSGEEITISYVSGLKDRKSRDSRQTIFQDSFGFTCSCRICSLPETESQQRDELIKNVVTFGLAGTAICRIRPLETMSDAVLPRFTIVL